MKKSKKETFSIVVLVLCILCVMVPVSAYFLWDYIPQNIRTIFDKPVATEAPAPSETDSIEATAAPDSYIIDELPSYDASANRVTYEEGFYYESVRDLPELMDRIRNVSFRESENNQITFDALSYVRVMYVNFEDKDCAGELVCHQSIAQDLVEIFYELYNARYQIESIRLVDDFNGDDTASMLANNTSCFNYRVIASSATLSKHGMGLAIDLNPFYNPYIGWDNDGNQIILPEEASEYADRSQDFEHKIDTDDLAYKAFTERGFTWGGNWTSVQDYQHFEK